MDYQTMSELIPKKSQKWSSEDISKWLQFINLPNLIPVFREAGIDGSCVHLIDDQILRNQLNIQSPIIRKKLINWVGFGLEGFNRYVKEKDTSFLPTHHPQLKKNQTTHIRKQPKSKPTTQDSHTLLQNQLSTMEQTEQYLILQQFEGNSLGFHIIKNQILSIGFGKNNNIHSLQTSISERHALIGKKNGKFFIQDQGSKYGTYIKISYRTQLRVGMILEIGSYQFLVSNINQSKKTILLKQIFQNIESQTQNENKNMLNISNKSNVEQKRNQSRGPLSNSRKNSGEDQTLLIDLTERSKYTFGRRRQNNYQRDDKHMSGIHCKITFFNNKFYIQDFQSTNGTWIRISEQYKMSPEIIIQNQSYIKLGSAITYICRINNCQSRKQKKVKQTKKVKKSVNSKLTPNSQIVGQSQSQMMIDQNCCQICQASENNCLFLPCSHNIVCMGCSENLKKCSECGHQIGQKIKIHK